MPAERLEQINKMHEEMMANAQRQQVEAGAASQLLGLLTRRRGSNASAPASAATTPSDTSAAASRRTSHTEAAAAAAAGGGAGPAGNHGQLLWGSLKQRMGLPEGAVGPLKERQLPAAPAKFVQAHAGGCCSLSLQPHGHLAASCGMDKTVQTWDLNLGSHVHTYHGMLGSVNDVSFSSDGRRLLGAGGDKRLLVWNTASGQVRAGHRMVVRGMDRMPWHVHCLQWMLYVHGHLSVIGSMCACGLLPQTYIAGIPVLLRMCQTHWMCRACFIWANTTAVAVALMSIYTPSSGCWHSCHGLAFDQHTCAAGCTGRPWQQLLAGYGSSGHWQAMALLYTSAT
ncbi:hypothetical protein COO60DRAFT_1230453 [Scenedesmus sp. NREL 46B-D3]|nr:hypothetical protein COO60DRAFT_1230453 [Scenedesmus sp. NREL 46B-D3]